MSDRLYIRGKIYWCWFYDKKGRLHRRSTKCRDRRAADAVLRRFERAAQDAADRATDVEPYSVDSAVADFVAGVDVAPHTIRMYDEKGRHVSRVLGHLDVSQLDQESVKGYIKKRIEEGAARETVRKELCTLRQTLYAAKEAGHYSPEPRSIFPRFRVRYVPRDRYLTRDEFRSLLAQLPPHRQLWLVIAVFTGGRDSEIDALRWEHVDYAAGRVRLDGTKTDGARRWVPLAALLRRVLAPLRQRSGVIVGEWKNVRRDLHAACKRAGIPHCSPNDLRRTYASWLKQDGVDSAVVARLLGHSSTRMVDLVYGKLDDATLARAIESLPGCESGVQDKSGRNGKPGKPGKLEVGGIAVSSVLGVGIEPTTRGFSVRVQSEPDARIIKMLSKMSKRNVKDT